MILLPIRAFCAREAQDSTRCRSRKKPHPFIRSTKRPTKVRADVARTLPTSLEVTTVRDGEEDDTRWDGETERARANEH